MDLLEARWVGFWHPVGPHGRETLQDIVVRKRQDLDQFGEVLWAFKRFREPLVDSWREVILQAQPADVLVFCGRRVDRSGTDRNRDTGEPLAHTHRRDSSADSAIPIQVGVTSSRGGDCAFVVRKIEELPDGAMTRRTSPTVVFYRPLQKDWVAVCRRGQQELLVKPAPEAIRPLVPSSGRVEVQVVLHLAPPYVTWVGGSDVQPS